MKRVVFIIVIAAACGRTDAQSDQPIAKLTYNEAVKIALKNNVDFNQQKNLLYSREVQRNQSIAALGPNLFIQGGGSKNIGQQPNPENGNLEDLEVSNFGTSINTNLPVFAGFQRVNTLKQNTSQFKAQTSLVKRTEQDVVYNVTIQLLQVLLDQELLKIAQENTNYQRTVLEQIRESVNVGARPEVDLYTQDAQVKNQEVVAIRARVTLENDKAILSQTLQLDPMSFEVVWPDRQVPTVVLDLSIDSLYALAITHREDLRQLNHQMQANEYQLRASAGAYYPNVNLFASYGTNWYSNLEGNPNFGDFNNQFMKVFPNTTYGVNFQIPIFNRLVTKNQRVFNRITYENSKLQRDNLEKAIKIDVQRVVNNYRAAIENYDASLAQQQSAELALKTQQESFNLGIAAQVELAQANQTYVQAAASKAQAEVTLVFQRMLLEYALGTLTPETLFDE